MWTKFETIARHFSNIAFISQAPLNIVFEMEVLQVPEVNIVGTTTLPP